MKKILLIGSSGFIGKKLKTKLIKNYELICPTKKQGFDITKKKELKKYFNHEIDVLINLSGQQNQNQTKMKKVIEKGNQNILDIAKKINKKLVLIYFSTSLVYGNGKRNKKESSKKNPLYAYEKMKYRVEKKYLKIDHNYLILRLCNIYGGIRNKGVVDLITNSVQKNKLFSFDNLKTNKNFIFIDDVINITDHLIKKNIKNKVLNIGNENLSFLNLVKILNKITNNSFRFNNKDINIDLTLSQKIDNNLIKNIIKKYKFKKIEKYLKDEISNRKLF